MSKIQFDWDRDISALDLDRERTVSAQNITSLTDKLMTVESALRDGEGYEGMSIPFAEKLASVLRNELEKEYEYLDLFDKMAAMRDLGVI